MKSVHHDVAAVSATSAQSELLNEQQAARYLNVAAKTLQNLRWKGGGPRFAKFGRLVRYRLVDLDAFVASHIHSSTSTESRA